MQTSIRIAALAAVAGLSPDARASENLAQFGKDVAAPAADIVSGRVVLPAPAVGAWRSPVQIAALRRAPSAAAAEARVAVDADGPLAIAVVARGDVDWDVVLVDPDGVERSVDALVAAGAAAARRAADLPDLPGASALRIDLAHARGGEWIVRAAPRGSAADARLPDAWIVARTSGTARLVAHASTRETRSDVPVAIVARLEAEGLASVEGRAEVEVQGGPLDLVLRDDGASGDGAAGDGTLGAFLPAWAGGPVRARVALGGIGADGARVERTSVVAFPVIERRVALTGVADAGLLPDGRIAIRVEAFPTGPAAKVLAAAEVWGTSVGGELVPLAWLARMQEPRVRADLVDLGLALDTRWIDMAGARAPFVLRNVRVQDPDTSVPHDVAREIPLVLPALPANRAAAPRAPTLAMLQGPSVAAARAAAQSPLNPTPFAPALMLVHGYCSGGSIWPAAHFSAPKLEFLDPNQNRTHDQFALLVRDAGGAQSSFGVVAHSQGGQAALHLYTYYASGLDLAEGPRRIQSVGSPYLGTPLASWGGFSCGVNSDMTTSSAPTWLAGIPSWARDDVYYWTTANSGSACNFFTSLLLDDPEDGTTERDRGQLAGANSMGHVVGWCHTTGMSNPAQYTDATRNAERNAQAAR